MENNTPINKEQEREELHRAIWKIADDLRGSIDGWDFKSYVLGFLFYRYLSERFCALIDENQHQHGKTTFSYAALKDEQISENLKQNLTNKISYFIYPSQLFCNLAKRAANDKNLNTTIAGIFSEIDKSAAVQMQGLLTNISLSSTSLGASVDEQNSKLTKILNGIASMKLGDFSSNSIDAFGDAYEYLMTMYASNAGKSGGEFFTPQEVSELLTRIVTLNKPSINTIYDPTCGSGSLLLKARKILGANKVSKFYGQEINPTTYNLCKINMFLHGVPATKFDIQCGDTLKNDKFPVTKDSDLFDCIVSNPPYSLNWEGKDNPLLVSDPRFAPAGVLAPKAYADLDFIMHILYHLKNDGAAAVVCFPGIMYRGHAEQQIRKYLIDNKFVEAIISLPENIFFGTNIQTDILVLKKNRFNSDSVRFIYADDQFVKVTNNNKLSPENIQAIMDMYTGTKTNEHVADVPYETIKAHKYNLSVTEYIDVTPPEEVVDIVKLENDIDVLVSKEDETRKKIAELKKGL